MSKVVDVSSAEYERGVRIAQALDTLSAFGATAVLFKRGTKAERYLRAKAAGSLRLSAARDDSRMPLNVIGHGCQWFGVKLFWDDSVPVRVD